MEVVVGIDVGTQGARALAVTPDGKVEASAEEKFPPFEPGLPAGWFEQDPRSWWRAVSACLRALTRSLPSGVVYAGVSVDSTSGTVLPVDGQGEPLYAALMYNDNRSSSQAEVVRRAGHDLEGRLGYAFGPSFALPKILWMKEERPEVFKSADRFIHATDFIIGCLSGDYGISDYCDALKTGYDLIHDGWPAFIEAELGIPVKKLPEVVAPGQCIGRVNTEAYGQTGLPVGTPVYAGVTDGVASHFASGAVEPGEWNTSFGVTLVLKGISETLVIDPRQRIYSHRHPEGWWMPGGASNTGTEWMAREFPGRDLKTMSALVHPRLPTSILRYPLVRTGERFPFTSPQAEGFTLGKARDEIDAFAAGMEGLALFERLAYDTLQSIGIPVGGRILITGSGARSDVWAEIRASVLQRVMARPEVSETAMGAALLAAAGVWYASLSQAVRAMVRIERTFEPNPALVGPYKDRYERFTAEMVRRGYITEIKLPLVV